MSFGAYRNTVKCVSGHPFKALLDVILGEIFSEDVHVTLHRIE
ncbi:MAG: hypothetical protein AAGB31_13000 [Bdellovibrio sp.]